MDFPLFLSRIILLIAKVTIKTTILPVITVPIKIAPFYIPLFITKQRLMLLDIILQEDCSCCKEIYFKASQIDSGIGTATIYRMVNTLEEIGAISRKNMYKIVCEIYNIGMTPFYFFYFSV